MGSLDFFIAKPTNTLALPPQSSVLIINRLSRGIPHWDSIQLFNEVSHIKSEASFRSYKEKSSVSFFICELCLPSINTPLLHIPFCIIRQIISLAYLYSFCMVCKGMLSKYCFVILELVVPCFCTFWGRRFSGGKCAAFRIVAASSSKVSF